MSCQFKNNVTLCQFKKTESPIIASYGGRRFFCHLEKEMAEFISLHHRVATVVLTLFLLLPALSRAQAQESTPAQSGSASDQGIPPAVAAQLDAMQKRIDQLELELKDRSSQSATVADGPAGSSPAHSVVEQQSGSYPAESALVEQSKPANKKPEPFSFADFTWLNGNSRIKEAPFDTKFFTPEIRVDTNYTYDFRHPKDDTIGGSSEIFRSEEFQVTQLGVGGDFHWDNVQARVMTQFGMYSTTTPRNDASPARGQWQLDNAYRYISEAYAGYHINKLDGINIQAGIFMSYIGLFSYYNFDNWAYQPSYVSSNTPWFFNGMRAQIYLSEHLKIEPWLINGWQSYGRFNNRPGVGGQILWRPNGWFLFRGQPVRTRRGCTWKSWTGSVSHRRQHSSEVLPESVALPGYGSIFADR